MGGPTLEVMRMALYVFTPVAMFYYFNLPEFYENNVKTKFVCEPIPCLTVIILLPVSHKNPLHTEN